MPVQATSVVAPTRRRPVVSAPRKRAHHVTAVVPDIEYTIDECPDPRNQDCACPASLLRTTPVPAAVDVAVDGLSYGELAAAIHASLTSTVDMARLIDEFDRDRDRSTPITARIRDMAREGVTRVGVSAIQEHDTRSRELVGEALARRDTSERVWARRDRLWTTRARAEECHNLAYFFQRRNGTVAA